MASRRSSVARKTSILPIEELEEVNGHLVGGEMTSRINGTILLVYAHTSPTYDVLKKEKYREVLLSLGLQPVLDSLPWGVDLQACVDFISTFDKKKKKGEFYAPDGMKVSVDISDQLMAEALGLRMEKWQSWKWQELKQKEIFIDSNKEHFKYNDLADQEMAKQLQVLDLLAMVSFPDHGNRVTAMGLTCLLGKKPALVYLHNQLMESLRKANPTLANPQLLTRILYAAAGLPMPNEDTASKENLLNSLNNSFVVGGKEAAAEEQSASTRPPPQEDTIGNVGSQQDAHVPPTEEAGTSHTGWQLTTTPTLPLEQFNVQDFFQKSPMNHKRQHEGSTYFEGLSKKLQRISSESQVISQEEESHKPQGPSLDELNDAIMFAHHLMLQQMKEWQSQAIEREVNKAMAIATKEHESQMWEMGRQKEALQEELANTQHTLREQAHKNEELHKQLEEVRREVNSWESKMKPIIEERTNLKALTEALGHECKKYEERFKAEEAQVHELTMQLKERDQEVMKLKSFTPDEKAKEEIQHANKRLTVVLNSLGSIGQYLWESKTVSETLELVQGNISLAMMKYGVNIKEMDHTSGEMLMAKGTYTTIDFVAFLTLAQQISLPDWSFLCAEPTFIIVRALWAWCALMEHAEIYTEEDDEMIQLEAIDIISSSSPITDEQYALNWRIMAALRKKILEI